MVSKKHKQLHQLLDQYLTSFEIEKSFDFDQTTLKISKDDLYFIFNPDGEKSLSHLTRLASIKESVKIRSITFIKDLDVVNKKI